MDIYCCISCCRALKDGASVKLCQHCGQKYDDELTPSVLKPRLFYPIKVFIEIEKQVKVNKSSICKIFLFNEDSDEIRNIDIQLESDNLETSKNNKKMTYLPVGKQDRNISFSIVPKYSGFVIFNFLFDFHDPRGAHRIYTSEITLSSLPSDNKSGQGSTIVTVIQGSNVTGSDLSNKVDPTHPGGNVSNVIHNSKVMGVDMSTNSSKGATPSTENCSPQLEGIQRLELELILENIHDFEDVRISVTPKRIPNNELNLSNILFLDNEKDSIVLVNKSDFTMGRSPEKADIEMTVLEPDPEKHRIRDKNAAKLSRSHFQIKTGMNTRSRLIDTSKIGVCINGVKTLKESEYQLHTEDLIQILNENGKWLIIYKYKEVINPDNGNLDAVYLERQNPNTQPCQIVLIVREISIGSSSEDTIKLPFPGIIKHHARLLKEKEILWLEPLSNGVKFQGTEILPHTKVQVGDYTLIDINGNYLKFNTSQTRFWKTNETSYFTHDTSSIKNNRK